MTDVKRLVCQSEGRLHLREDINAETGQPFSSSFSQPLSLTTQQRCSDMLLDAKTGRVQKTENLSREVVYVL